MPHEISHPFFHPGGASSGGFTSPAPWAAPLPETNNHQTNHMKNSTIPFTTGCALALAAVTANVSRIAPRPARFWRGAVKSQLPAVFGVALAMLTLAGLAARAQSVPVEFGSPSNLEVIPGTAAASSSWGLLWDYSNTGFTQQTLQMEYIPNKPASIVPSPSGHAINTKGTGASGRFALTPTVAGTPVVFKAIGLSVDAATREFVRARLMTFQVGDDDGLHNAFFDFILDITAPDGFDFGSDPVITVDADLSGFTFQYDITPPAGFTGDPNLVPIRYALSATASTVPEPASAALLGLGTLLLAARRRRSAQA